MNHEIQEKEKHEMILVEGDHLFDRVVSILEQARANVVRSVNSNMVYAYWLIGREIVEDIQGGKKRAEYGKQTLQDLSERLTKRYQTGFSVPNLQNFRKFYLAYPGRMGIQYPSGIELPENESAQPNQYPMGRELSVTEKGQGYMGFNPQLSWSHYRALMRVDNPDARLFYEEESAECGWDKRTLERHIHSQYFERMLKNQETRGMYEKARCENHLRTAAIDTLKSPYVLEFLDLPDASVLHESQLETAIITSLQDFLLELGKGFAFVARQKRLSFDNTDLYVDLVFYNCILKFYLLIDLKMGELSHRDVGQMDGYVRLFDDLYIAKDDNPTIGLILCTEKNEAVAQYSVLNERTKISASKYMLCLPTEEELARELVRERHLIEAMMDDHE